MPKHDPAPSAELIGANVAAEILGVSLTRLRQLDDVLSPFRLGKRRVFSRAVVESLAGARAAQRAEAERRRAERSGQRAAELTRRTARARCILEALHRIHAEADPKQAR